MLYVANGLRSVNAINLRGLGRRHLPEAKLVALAVETRLGLAQPTHFRTRDVCALFDVPASAVNAGIHDWAVANGIQQLARITADVINGKGNGASNGTYTDSAIQFAETLKTMTPDELATSFKIAGSEVIWGALVRAL
jgi:hypothetical protein